MDITSTPENDRAAPTVLRASAAFATAFLLTAALIHSILPSPITLYATMRSEKLALLQQWQPSATSAAFGSSHVHNGFDPRAFDRALASTPLRTTTINLGIEGGSQAEQRQIALLFLQHLQPHPGQSCTVLLELNAGANFTNDHLVHPRAIDLYDWRTVRFLAQLSPQSLGPYRAAGRFGYALAASAMYYANVGMLSNHIFHPPLDPEIVDNEDADDRRGLLIPPPVPGGTEYLTNLFAHLPHTVAPVPQPMLPGNYTLISELIHASPVRGVHFAYFVTPLVKDLASYPAFPSSLNVAGETIPIFSMACPDLYPDMYEPQYWHDDAHLNESGAALLGQHLAAQMITWYAAHPQAQTCGD